MIWPRSLLYVTETICRIYHLALSSLVHIPALKHRWEIMAQAKTDDRILLEILKMDLADLEKEKAALASGSNGLDKQHANTN